MKHTFFFTFIMIIFFVTFSYSDTLRVACIGNSITEGATLSSPSDAYPALLNYQLGTSYDVNNYGVGGRVLLKNGDYPIWDEVAFRRALEFDPDIVTIMLGTNDSKPWNWADYSDEFVPDYIDMIQTFRNLDNNARFLLAYPPPAFSNLGSIRDSVIYNEIIPLIDSVASVTGTTVVDFYNPMKGDSDMFPDGIHPNESGHEKIAGIFKTAIETLPAVVDTLPTWFTKVPVGFTTIYDSAAYLVNVRTAGRSMVKYSTIDQSYDLMENTFSVTGDRDHFTIIRGEHGQVYTYYLRAMDTAGNPMDTSATISFTFDTTKVLYNWKEEKYPDSLWNTGPALFGNSQVGSKVTILNDVYTAYFRNTFSIEDHASITGIGFLVKGQSGSIVYLNNHEIERINMPDTEIITYDDYAEESLNLNKMVVITADNGLEYLKTGTNIVAVEMHVSSDATPPLSFNGQLIDNTNKIYIPLGSEWIYSDVGSEPGDTLIDKGTQTAISEMEVHPKRFSLSQNYPNPFNPTTTIKFTLAENGSVKLMVYDLSGRRVAELLNKKMQAGPYSIEFNGHKLASGIYLYHLITKQGSLVRKMVLLK